MSDCCTFVVYIPLILLFTFPVHGISKYSTIPNCDEQPYLVMTSISLPIKVNFTYKKDEFVKVTTDSILTQIKMDILDNQYENKMKLKSQCVKKNEGLRIFKVPKKRLSMLIDDPYLISKRRINLQIPLIYLTYFDSFDELIALYKGALCMVYDQKQFCLANLNDFAETGFVSGTSCEGEIPDELIHPGVIVDFFGRGGIETPNSVLNFLSVVVIFHFI